MSVAKVTSVKKARKDQGKCEKCRVEIRKGDAYQWWTIGFRSRYKHRRCANCPTPPPSARESNEKVALILGAKEALTENLSEAKERDDVVSALQQAGETIREAAELWNESADSIEEGFEHETEQSMELREKADGAEAWAEALDDAASEIEEEPDDDDTEALRELGDLTEFAQAAFDDNQSDY